MTGGAVIGGLSILEMALVASVYVGPRPIPGTSGAAPPPSLHTSGACQSYVHLLDVDAYARELDEPPSWVEENYRIGLWSSLALDRSKTGELAPGASALVLAENEYGYKVVTSDGAQGWVSKFQVSDTLRREADTDAPCQ